MMSGQASIEMAVKATRLGAADFLEKPISTDKLLLTVENVLRLKHLENENRDLKKRLGRHPHRLGQSGNERSDGPGGTSRRKRNTGLRAR